jgi:hypothetical protein
MNGRTICLAQPGCGLNQCIEHGLEIERRAADNLEHVGGRSLLLQRLPQLVEQAHVLDCNNGLGGERGYKLDLFLRERLHDQS